MFAPLFCRSARPERVHREPHRRLERHRHRGGRARGAGWLHASVRVEFEFRGQSGGDEIAALRHPEGAQARRSRLLYAARAGGSRVVAGEQRSAISSRSPSSSRASSPTPRPGAGGAIHLASELFKREAGVDLVHVPYRGGGPAVLGLLSGDVDVFISDLSTTVENIRGGRLKALAMAWPKRSPFLPEAPTFAELGYPAVVSSSWFGLAAPVNTPADIVDRLAAGDAAGFRVTGVPGAVSRSSATSSSRLRPSSPQPSSGPRWTSGLRSPNPPTSRLTDRGRVPQPIGA